MHRNEAKIILAQMAFYGLPATAGGGVTYALTGSSIWTFVAFVGIVVGMGAWGVSRGCD